MATKGWEKISHHGSLNRMAAKMATFNNNKKQAVRGEVLGHTAGTLVAPNYSTIPPQGPE